MSESMMIETAVFGAGCFWGVEAAFRKVPGVVSTRVGYSGGTKTNPSYQDVCTDQTGHAEVVEISYNPNRISFEELLTIFWKCHDPTQQNRQGPDVGTQYRSVIFFQNSEQERLARISKETMEKSGRFRAKIATQIVPAVDFWEAEEYHQQYLEKRGLGTCHLK